MREENEKNYHLERSAGFQVTSVVAKAGGRQKMDKEKEIIIQKLKAKGCRMTKQRMVLLDIILENQCSSCKEIFYRASHVDSRIGIATVYRMVNALEEIGVVSRKIVYEKR